MTEPKGPEYARDANGEIIDAKERKPAVVRPIRPDIKTPRGDWTDRLVRSGRGYASCQANAITILRNDEAWRGVIAWDDFSQGVVTITPPPWDEDDRPSEAESTWQETDATRLSSWLSRHYEIHLSAKLAYGAAVVVAEGNRVNRPLAWLESLVWDGRFRLDTWLTTYLGCEDTPYVRLVGRYFLISAAARMFRPGCKVDCMLVLEGDQGEKKSSSCKILFGEELFTDTPIELESKDRFLALRGRWGAEFAELDSFRKVHSSRTKSFVSSPTDDFRPPYAANTIRVKRRCVLIGSVNPVDTGYFTDETGNRRYWPVRCAKLGPILLDELGRDRDVLWAEAKEAFVSGARWWPETKEERALCNDEQEARMVLDPWLGSIERYLDKQAPMMSVTIREVLEYGVGLEVQKHDRSAQSRAGGVLAMLRWAYCGRPKTSHGRERAYMRKGDIEAKERAEAAQRAAEEARLRGEPSGPGGDPDVGF
jgi:putative DNA primase/helicase